MTSVNAPGGHGDRGTSPIWRASLKKPQISADEPRLLRGSVQTIDPDAIPITKPGSQHSTNAMKRIPSEFRTINTLGQGANTILLTSQNYSTEPQNHNRGKRNPGLDFEIRVGENVYSRSNGPEIALSQFPEPQLPEPQLKRRKLEPNRISDSTNHSNDFDPASLNGDEYSVSYNRNQQTTSQGHSIYSIGSNVDAKMEPYLQTRVAEYASVEKTMVSKKKTHGWIRSRNSSFRMSGNNSVNPPTLSNSSSVTGRNSAWALLDDELSGTAKSTPRLRYSGTARNPPNGGTHKIPVANRRHDTGRKSSYFQDSQASKIMGSRGGRAPPKNSTLISHSHETCLSDQFRDTNGKQRGSGIDNLSSDELGSCTTVGSLAMTERASPEKPSSSASPTKTPYSAQQTMVLDDSLQPSNIPHSIFTIHKRGNKNKKFPIEKVARAGESNFLRNIELDSYITDEEFVERKCHLDFNDAEKILNIIGNDNNAIGFSIQLRRLLKITWSPDSRKVRLDLSKCVNSSQILDIQICSEIGVKDFVGGLLSVTASKDKIEEDGNRMDRMFEKRLSEQKNFSRTNRTVSKEDPWDDVQLAAENLKRSAETTGHDSSEQTSSKRRGTVVGRLTRNSDDQTKTQLMQQKTNNETDPRELREEFTNLNEIMRNLHQKTSNPHPRSSRRRPDSEFRQLEDPLSATEECPQSLGFSKTVGLGEKWDKPLLYPKNGKKKTTVDWLDLERLDDAQFLNDNLIGFYLRFLENQLEERQPDLAKKVYFFNTFFFASLTNTQERQKLINYESVQKWTRSVDIFTYDYIVVPINESAHWYVAIICNLSALVPSPIVSDEATKDDALPSPNQEEHSDQAKTPPVEPKGSSSSLIADVVGGEYVSLVAENSNDQDPTTSFAGMTLENSSNEPAVPGNEVQAKWELEESGLSPDMDQGMLNAQIDESMAEHTANHMEEIPKDVDDVKNINEAEHAAQAQTPKLSSLSKKRKRKSIPPIMKHDPNSPTIVTFDSLGLPHTPTTRVLKEYLLQEGRAKRGFIWDELPIRGITAKEIPQQDNFCDCGLFLLGYIDKFLDDPKDFISKILKREYNLETDWPRMIPSDLRVSIRQQIQKLHGEQEAERRDSAKKTNKHRGKQDSVHRSLPGGSAPSNASELKTKENLPFVSVVISKNTSTQLVPTRAKALETALAINEEEPEHPIKTGTKQVDRDTIDVPDDDPSSAKNDDPSVVILDSQSDQAESKLKYQEPSLIPADEPSLSSKSLTEVTELPNVIQDSQPGSLRASPSKDPPKTISDSSSPEIEDSPCILPSRSPLVGQKIEELERRSDPSSKPPKQKQRESSVIQLD